MGERTRRERSRTRNQLNHDPHSPLLPLSVPASQPILPMAERVPSPFCPWQNGSLPSVLGVAPDSLGIVLEELEMFPIGFGEAVDHLCDLRVGLDDH